MKYRLRASRVAQTRSILATAPVIENARSAELLERNGQKTAVQSQALRGIASGSRGYEIP